VSAECEVDYGISDDGQLVADGLRRYLQARMPPLTDTFDQALVWKDLAGSGWLEAYAAAVRDGTQASLVEALYAMEAFGEVPVPGPVAVVAGLVLPLADGIAGSDLHEEVRAGRLLTAVPPRLTGTGSGARWTYRSQKAVLRNGPTGLVVDGVIDRVPGAEHADAVLIVANRGEHAVVVTVPLDGPGVTVTSYPGLDLRFSAAQVDLDGARVGRVFEADDIGARAHAAGPYFSLFLDAEAVGGAAEITKRTVAYVREREQFGRPVGSFQAVRHKLADMHVWTETARSLTYQAAWDLFGGGPDALADILASRLHASTAYVRVCESAIQCHGGMGFTWEQGLHVWYRSAIAARGLLSDIPGLRQALGGHLQSVAKRNRL
jgi:alkylation response protein AidB-like acyl-CoA dehydrogenase